MSESFIGQIMPVAFGFAPRSWSACNGQIMAISQNQALFSLIGTVYGGDGNTTFVLPDLRSRTPIGVGMGQSRSYALGQIAGTPTVTLTQDNLPPHSHVAMVNNGDPTNNSDVPSAGAYVGLGTIKPPSGVNTPINLYQSGANNPVATALGGVAGAGQPHPNLQPYNVINFCICLNGLYPSRG